MKNFSDRLEHVLGGRKITRWGQSIGLNSGTTGRINQGHTPGPLIMRHIARVENASMAYLMEGRGAPFLLHSSDSDSETAQYLSSLLSEPGWRLDLLSDGDEHVIIGTLPAQTQYKNEMVDYTVTEVLTGPVGAQTAQVYNAWPRRYHRILHSDLIHEIKSGELGSYRIGRLINESKPGGDLDPAPAAAAEAAQARQLDTLISAFKRLSPHNRDSVLMIIDTLLDAQRERH